MNHRAVLLFGHADLDPANETLNHQLAQSYSRGYESQGGTIQRIDLASLVFDPVLRSGFREPQALEPDLVRVKEAIEQANHLVWVFPTYWASPPALVRGLFDRLFLPGWAFRYESGNPLPARQQALYSSQFWRR
jgi:NAD(P)H dehydrogenase (quinone)